MVSVIFLAIYIYRAYKCCDKFNRKLINFTQIQMADFLNYVNM